MNLRRHLTIGNVLASLALFVALGGVASAVIGGSGNVKSGAIKGPTGHARTILKMDGVGLVTASCNGGSTGVDFVNTSSRAEEATVDLVGSPLTSRHLAPGKSYHYGTDSVQDEVRLHVFPSNGADAPQTLLSISILSGADCPHARVAAEATTTSP
jgi:hypothetical protein